MGEIADKRLFTYRLDGHDTVTVVNDAWLDFAKENGAQYLDLDNVIGKSLWSFLSDETTCQLYHIILDRVRSERKSVILAYRCDSPTVRRFMEMMVVPLDERQVQFISRLVRLEARDYVGLLDVGLDRSDEFLTICSWCKQVQIPDGRWVEVEQAVQAMHLFDAVKLPQLSHGMCEVCRDDYQHQLSVVSGASET